MRHPWTRPMLVSLAAVAVAAVGVLVQLPAVVAALAVPSPGTAAVEARLADYLESHRGDLETYVERFNGRSLFERPAPPPRERPPVVRRTEPEEEDDSPPPPPPEPRAPARYTGPSVLFVLGEEVWFHNGLRLRVGEESDGVRVLASDPPWSVRLAHAGGEYDVELFKRDFPGLERTAPRARGDTPGLVMVEAPREDEDESAQPEQQ